MNIKHDALNFSFFIPFLNSAFSCDSSLSASFPPELLNSDRAAGNKLKLFWRHTFILYIKRIILFWAHDSMFQLSHWISSNLLNRSFWWMWRLFTVYEYIRGKQDVLKDRKEKTKNKEQRNRRALIYKYQKRAGEM